MVNRNPYVVFSCPGQWYYMQIDTVKIKQMGLLADKSLSTTNLIIKSNRKEVIQDDGRA